MNDSHLKQYLAKYPWRPLTNDAGEQTGEWLTCPVRLAFAYLGEPRKNQRGQSEFSTSCIIPASADLAAVFKAAVDLGTATFGPGYQSGVKNDSYKFPFKRQAKPFEKGYAGFSAEGFYFDAKTQYAPGIVDRSAVALDAKSDAVYSGMWAIVRVSMYAYGGKGSTIPGMTKGVGFGLRAIQKIADDEIFRGEGATSIFGEVEALPGAASGPSKAPDTGNAFDLI